MVLDTQGHKKTFTGSWGSLEGLAWSPGGKELWFIADNPDGGWANVLRALSPSG
ncbi:MAG: hypothetical protein WA477_15220 [Candidatus Sulfotelmatobacter sp.]